MGYVIRQSTTGKICAYSTIAKYYFHDPAERNPYIFADIGHAKAAITKAPRYHYGSDLEEIRALCLGLEIVEVTENYSVTYGPVVFSQLFRADKT